MNGGENDKKRAKEIVNELYELNVSRKKQQAKIVESLELPDFSDRFSFVHWDQDYVGGIVGLIAGDISRNHYRVCFIGHQVNDESIAFSGRSIPEISIVEILGKIDKESDCLISFGGHKGAGGCLVDSKKVDQFSELVEKYSSELADDINKMVPSFDIEGVINLKAVSKDTVYEINKLGPFGMNFPKPLFMTENVKVLGVTLLGKHIKIKLNDGKKEIDSIAFFKSEWSDHIKAGDMIDIVFEIGINEWRGVKTLQLNLKDFRFSEDGTV